MSITKIKLLEKKRMKILSNLLESGVMVKGSYCCVYTKCGKKNCCCKKGKGHRHSRITWSENGKVVTRKVPIDEVEWIKEMTMIYRLFRKMRKDMSVIDTEIKMLLNELEHKLTTKAKHKKAYLSLD